MPTAVPITATPLAAQPAPDLVRQISILAIAAFAIGFVGFLALGGPMSSAAAAAAEPPAIAVIQPADESLAATPTSDDWNLPKKI